MKRLICLFLICLLLCGCSPNTEKTLYHMNTVMHLELVGKDCDTAAARCDVILRDLEKLWSVTDENSTLSAINRGQDVKLDDPYQTLLDKVESLSQRTGGAFNPKLYALSKTWGFYNEEFRIPTAEEITEALTKDQWDLGAALKGYAGYRLTQELDKLKIDRAMLNLGGNIQTYGKKSDGSAWKIGIQNPDGGDYLGVISVTGTKAIVTSGDYQRYFEIDGVRYHHILDPETGFPADSGLRSVTIICDDGLTADAFSTALFVMGLEEATEFWRASNDFEAVFITSDGKVHATEGVSLSGCDYEVITR